MASIIFTIPARYGKRRGPRQNAKTAYQQRDEALLRLGFASYRDYLKSPIWKAIRQAKLAVDPNCEICRGTAQQVHHISYRRDVLTGKSRHHLVSICVDCHHRIEFRADGSKRGFEASRKLTKRLLRRNGRWAEHTKHGPPE